MKDTFILKTKYGSVVNKLSDKQAGVLFKMLFEYVENGANAGSTDEKVEMAFEFIKLDLDAFSESYQKKLAVSKENGRKGGNPNFVKGKSNPYYDKKDNPNITEDNPTLPNITEDNPTLPNITEDNPNDNDNDLYKQINKQAGAHEENPEAEKSTLTAYEDFKGNLPALEAWLAKRWNDAKKHYKAGVIGKVAILGQTKLNLIEVAKTYTQREIDLAIKGVFIQKEIYPQFTLSPDKMLETDHFSKFYNAGLTNTQLYNESPQKGQKSSKKGVVRNVGDL